MTQLQDLIAQRHALDAQIAQAQQAQRADAIARVRALMAEHGLTVDDLSERAPAPRKVFKPVSAKYVNRATGETWSGRGLQPKWLRALIASGAKLQDFAV